MTTVGTRDDLDERLARILANAIVRELRAEAATAVGIEQPVHENAPDHEGPRRRGDKRERRANAA